MTRALLLSLLAALLLSALGIWGQAWLAATPVDELPVTPVAMAPIAQPVQIITATVLQLEGDAQQFEPETQAWTNLQIGSPLEQSALLRTLSGKMTITIGAATEVEVSPDSRLRLEQMSETQARVNLEAGRISGRVAEGSAKQLAVNVAGNEAVATTKGGKFSILRGNNADVTVAGQGGTVTVAGPERSVVIQEGQQTTAAVGKSPSPAIKIPSSLFVKLTRTGNHKLRTRYTTIVGSTTPGSVVSVNGVQATAVDGKFRVNVPLKEGENSVEVVARDVLGRIQTKRVSGLLVDSKPPKIQGSVQW